MTLEQFKAHLSFRDLKVMSGLRALSDGLYYLAKPGNNETDALWGLIGLAAATNLLELNDPR